MHASVAAVTSAPRNAGQRKADALAKLGTPAVDVWVATAAVSDTGSAVAHLVPLSLAWLDDRVVIAVEAESITARNIIAGRTARLAVGQTRDVVIIDAVLDRVLDLAAAPAALADGYAAQADWDPRAAAGRYLYVVLRPHRVQVWREEKELAGRTIMRDGAWVV